MSEERKNMELATKKALSKEEEAIQIAMKTVFWLSQENLPLEKYHSLIIFLKHLKVPKNQKRKTIKIFSSKDLF